jgi:hypothetical protein
MKKLPIILLLFASAAGASGLGLAYGGGILIHFSPVTFNGTYNATGSQVTGLVSVTNMQFFDATYFELHVGYTLVRGSTEPAAVSTTTGFAALLTGLSFGASVKYPIVFGPIAIFPIVGIDYVLNLGYSDDKGDDLKSGLSSSPSALDELWVKGGLGVDVNLGPLFLRPVLFVGFMPLNLGGVPTLTSTHPTGIITLDRGAFSVDLNLLFGVRF